MPEIIMKTKGFARFEKQLGALPLKMEKKIVKKAVRAGQKKTLAKARSNAKTLIGGEMGALIARSIKIKIYKKKRKGYFGLGVELLPDPAFIHINADGGRNFIPTAIEFGHGSGKDDAAIPYMRNAHETTKRPALAAVAKEIRKGLLESFKGK